MTITPGTSSVYGRDHSVSEDRGRAGTAEQEGTAVANEEEGVEGDGRDQ